MPKTPTATPFGSSAPQIDGGNDVPTWSFGWKSSQHAQECRSVSCVIWSSNAAARLEQLLPSLCDMLTECGHPWEIIVVDAKSSDGTRELLERWTKLPGMREIALNGLGVDEALSTGLRAARGAAVICIDANLSHSPTLIPQMISHWKNGAEVVYALRQGLPQRSELNWFGASVFHRMATSGRPMDWLEDCGDLTLLNRKVLDHLNP